MINNASIFAVVPARSGSKGLKGKNMMDFHGRPLIAWSVLAGIRSKYIDKVLVTTDCTAIESCAVEYGAVSIGLRPTQLSLDHSPVNAAVEHLLREIKTQSFGYPTYILLLEPTSPLRTSADLDAMIELLESSKSHADAVISVCEVTEHPSINQIIADGYLRPYENSKLISVRRQDCSKLFFPYGLGYLIKTSTFSVENTFYCERAIPYEIPKWKAFEIDDLDSFRLAEIVFGKILKGCE